MTDLLIDWLTHSDWLIEYSARRNLDTQLAEAQEEVSKERQRRLESSTTSIGDRKDEQNEELIKLTNDNQQLRNQLTEANVRLIFYKRLVYYIGGLQVFTDRMVVEDREGSRIV